jgi:hypothetical protein
MVGMAKWLVENSMFSGGKTAAIHPVAIQPLN